MSDTFDYDVFLSHSPRDRSVVRALAERLRSDGLRVCFDEAEPPDVKPLLDGLESSRVLVPCLSADFFASTWGALESHSLLFRDATEAQRRFIPLRLDDSELPDTMRSFASVDWRQRSEAEYAKLRRACTASSIQVLAPTSSLSVRNVRALSFGHTDQITSVALTPDGRLALSGSADRVVRVWDVASGLCLSALEGHTASVWSVALTPNGRLAFSGSDDRTVRVWEVASGRCLSTLVGHTDSVWALAATPEGRLAISGGDDRTLRVWDVTTSHCRLVLEGHTASVLGVAVTADGRTALSGADDGTLRVWDLTDGRCLSILEGQTESVTSVALTADGKVAVSGAGDGTVRKWDLASGRCLSILTGHTARVSHVVLTPDGWRALSAAADWTLRVWDLAEGTCCSTLEGHTNNIWSVALSEDGRLALSGSVDRTLRVWEVDNGNRVSFLGEHTDRVSSVALTADGRLALSGAWDRTVRLWEVASGRCLSSSEGDIGAISSVALTGDGRFALSGAADNLVRVWDIAEGRCIAILPGHTASVASVALTGDGRFAVSGATDGTARVWDVSEGYCRTLIMGHGGTVSSVAISANGEIVLTGSDDRTIGVWESPSGERLFTLEGHTNSVMTVALTADGRIALSGAADNTVRIWDVARGRCLSILEGHTQAIRSVAVTPDGRLAFSGASDHTVRVWDVASGRCLSVLEGSPERIVSVAVSEDGQRVLALANNGVARAWQLTLDAVDPALLASLQSTYTNAKVLLVGDSGVGKTGLALRLTRGRFEATVSTEGHWATQLRLPQDANAPSTERELWLWDFAGQSDYRLIHQLFMDETSLALLVFDPQDANPFDGLGQWARDLSRATRRPFRKLLVAGRCDRGGLTVSRAHINRFVREHGFDGYLETSASTGAGCTELLDAIRENIDWSLPTTVSPRSFKRLKDEILRLRDEGLTLLRMGELKQQLEMRLTGEPFSPEELQAVIRLLAGPGVVWKLEFGDFVLLRPELINAYAAAMIRTVRAHTDEVGVIAEQRVLKGELDYQGMSRLRSDEEQLVLRAMHHALIDRDLCLRESTDSGTWLVFPAYFKRERPDLLEHPSALVSYTFSGALDEIYTTLVVRLHHTALFTKEQLWRYAADFKTPSGLRVGLKLEKKSEGTAELLLYCDPRTSDDTKLAFVRYVHDHLHAKGRDIERLRHYECPQCREPVGDRRAVQNAFQRNKKLLPCQFCDGDIPLRDVIEERFGSKEVADAVSEITRRARLSIDNESRELRLVGEAYSVVAEAGQIFRTTSNSDWGIDGEIEFKDDLGRASGQRVYLQLKSGDSYLSKRKDGREIFTIHNPRHADYWQQQAYPVMLVVRTSDGVSRWMDVTAYLEERTRSGEVPVRHIVFEGEPFTAFTVLRLRDRHLPPGKPPRS
jgi:WD40 repeat protein